MRMRDPRSSLVTADGVAVFEHARGSAAPVRRRDRRHGRDDEAARAPSACGRHAGNLRAQLLRMMLRQQQADAACSLQSGSCGDTQANASISHP